MQALQATSTLARSTARRATSGKSPAALPAASRPLVRACAGAAAVPRGIASSVNTTTTQPIRRGVCVAAAANSNAVVLAADVAPAAPKKKPRVPAFDSLRFFLIMYIATGHFVTFATGNAFAINFFSQINVVVGAFFVLSGYVAGYTSTLLGERKADPRISPAINYSIQRVMGFYPLFLLVQLLFAPMFAYADVFYNGVAKTIGHFACTLTLSQAWFPAHAELWNAPTWFLSALAFCMFALPHLLPSFAEMRKKGLRLAFFALVGVSLVAKIAYSYDLGIWGVMEGTLRKHPNLLFWNIIRFNPFYALLEVLMGVCACRLVMLDDTEGEEKVKEGGILSTPLVHAVVMITLIVLRATGTIALNDALTRGLVFIPLWSLFLVCIHRESVREGGARGLTKLLQAKPLGYLGLISFPIFVLHGALGQLFYKKVIATKLFGAVMSAKYGYPFFYFYMGLTIVLAAVVNKVFLENQWVRDQSKAFTKWACGLFA